MVAISSVVRIVSVPLTPTSSKALSGGVFNSPGSVEYLTVYVTPGPATGCQATSRAGEESLTVGVTWTPSTLLGGLAVGLGTAIGVGVAVGVGTVTTVWVAVGVGVAEDCVGGSVVTFDGSLVVSDIVVPLTVTEVAGGMLVAPILPAWPIHIKNSQEGTTT